MNTQQLLLGGFAATVALSLMIGAWGRRKSSGSLVSFFWGDNSFNVAQGTHLNLSTSFAVNGVLYSAWLGYKAGWVSVLPQVMWCFGFLFLARYAKRLAHLARTGTLHGNIGYVFGKHAARWAAFASIIGFTLLFGWELWIGASMFKAVTPDNVPNLEILLYFSLAGIAAVYCMLGGMRGNLLANQFQNYLSGAALLVAIIYLGWFAVGTQKFSWNDFTDASTFTALATELTIAGIITNAILFSVYQFLDMSVWQNIASVSDEGRAPRKTLWASAFWIFIFPGVTGSALGMLMRSHTSGVTPDNIVPQLLLQVSAEPAVFVLLVMGFFAMMLSTVDGLLLAAGQAVTWDLTDRKRVLRILTTNGTSKFGASDIARARPLARKIAGRGDPLSDYIWNSLSDQTRTMVTEANQTNTDILAAALAEELTRIHDSGPLYTRERFAHAELRSQTQDLLATDPQGERLSLLNRWLLEDAYAEDIWYNQYTNTLRHEGNLNKDGTLTDQAIRDKESRVISNTRYAIFFVALFGGAATLLLVRGLGVDSFNLLYVTYVAQMALFPVIWVILHGDRKSDWRGSASIPLGLLAGFATVVIGLTLVPSLTAWSPTIAVAVACIVYWPFRRFKRRDPRDPKGQRQ